jgi:chemotaxis protein methyltransferase CheR
MKMFFTNEQENKLKSFITDRSGLYFKDHDLGDLKGAVSERMKTLESASVSEYCTQLTDSIEGESEFRELLNLLTIKHTYFFRNEAQFKALKEEVLPEIVTQKRKKLKQNQRPCLRVWSAGCATGEEPYSIAMAIMDVIDDIQNWDIEVYATDVSTDALTKSKKGIYKKSVMRLVDKWHENQYFIKSTTRTGDVRYKVRDVVKSMVKCEYLNLMEKNFPTNFDIIFCRNVVIYFKTETTVELMDRFYASLTKNGFMFAGYSESLQFISDKFKMVDASEAVYYRKVASGGAPGDKVRLDPSKEVEGLLEDLARAEIAAEIEEIKDEAERNIVSAGKMKNILVEILKCSHLKKYDKALLLVDEARQINSNVVEPYYLAAEIYANQRRFDKAKEQIKLALSKNSFFAPVHYLSGSIYMEEEDTVHAKESFKKALYLDKDFTLAYFNLAAAYKKEGRTDETIRAYRNTLKALSRYPSDAIVAYSGGFSASTMVSICRDNLERLKEPIAG